MNKMAVAAVVLATAAGAYYVTQSDSSSNASSSSSNPMLDYVPADTLAFSGQLTPFPLKDYLYSVSGYQQQAALSQIDAMSEGATPGEGFLISLYKQYLTVIGTPETMLSTYGLPDSMQSYFYTLGALPVMKLQLANPVAFWAELDRAEAESGFTHTAKDIAGQAYRAYVLTEEAETDSVEVVFAEKDGWLTVTLNTSLNQPELLETALGLKTVANPISKTTILQDIVKTHGFKEDSVSFINHQELVNGLTSTEGNLLAKQIAKFVDKTGEDPFAMLKTAECKTELAGIAANWPRTVIGLNSFSITKEQTDIDAAVVIESKNQVVLGALAKIRGFIPSFATDIENNVFSMAFGNDVAQLAPSLTTIWEDALKPSYTCAPLAEMQAEMSGQNPAMLGMMTGMANGVKGLSVTLRDYKLTELNDEPALESVDALVSISADNPAMLVNMAKSFVPQLATIQMDENSEPVDVTSMLMLPPEIGVKANLAIKGKHLVLYSGEQGEQLANQLGKEALESNGIFTFAVDYKKMITPLLTMIEMSGEPVPEELEMLKNYDMRVSMSVDVNDKGIVFGSKMNTKVKQ